ncbi:MAG TPA: 16S rRNA (adenine(1518)-N(6)/adenine(1519)-N(6))-dimethyltransferase RsmA [Pyrinomonadaceae bacterium]|nr:16S rRNA (adenine(1518)-N(6)/adenine(1519)-N(6))-dimethyltransferase RsmA [Pyrinomonadaceae bacterium]
MAKKSLGQNFLVDEGVVARIVREVAPRADETIVEIGAGRGALTAALVGQAGRLIAVEFDRDLVPLLHERFGGRDNFTLVEADALAIDFCATILPARAARVVANLPYNISTAILQRLFAQRHCLTEMTLMLQREVVERVTAAPGTAERGYLSVLTEAYCEAHTLFDVRPEAFRPVPKVWSTVVRLVVRESVVAGVSDEALLWRTVSAGFAQRRKTIFNNLRHAPPTLLPRVEAAGGAHALLEQAGVEPQRRAETLTLAEWVQISRGLETTAAPDN